MRRFAACLAVVPLLCLFAGGQWLLRSSRPASAPVLAEGAFAAIGGLLSSAA